VFPSQNDIAALPEVEHHNNQIQAAIDFHCNNRPSFAIIDKGRNNEGQLHLGRKRTFYGMGYLDTEIAINDLYEIKNTLFIQSLYPHELL
jgi:DNA polymerase-3 subunit epsilon